LRTRRSASATAASPTARRRGRRAPMWPASSAPTRTTSRSSLAWRRRLSGRRSQWPSSAASFLQTRPLPEPLTWEAIEAALPTLGPTNRHRPKQLRACLRDLGHLLAACGELERRETYVLRHRALAPIARAPAHIRPFLVWSEPQIAALPQLPCSREYDLRWWRPPLERKGVGGKEFPPRPRFRRRRISCQRSWRAA
jgi:hypothetical protein